MMKLLLDLFLTFSKIGLFTFGGGYAMIPLIENVCVTKKEWITHEEMMNITVVAESTPGPIAINCATYVGLKKKGFWGAVAATLGVTLPSFLIILMISFFLVIDCILTMYALNAFLVRKVHDFNILVENRNAVEINYQKIYGNKALNKITYTLFGDRKMIKTFPNLKVEDKDGNIIFFDNMVGGIKPYYYKFKLIKRK